MTPKEGEAMDRHFAKELNDHLEDQVQSCPDCGYDLDSGECSNLDCEAPNAPDYESMREDIEADAAYDFYNEAP